MAPSDGEALLISRMKRAPGWPSIAARLRFVGFARERRASSVAPAKRCASSSLFASAMRPRTQTGSATAGLDETIEHATAQARQQDLSGIIGSIFQRWRFARGMKERRR